MATILESITWSAEGENLKKHLGISGTAEDTRLQDWLEEAAEACHEELEGKNFVDAAGEDAPVPKSCRMGVFMYVKAMRDRWARSAGVTETKSATRGEKSSDEVDGELAMKMALPHLRRHVDDVTKLGSVSNG